MAKGNMTNKNLKPDEIVNGESKIPRPTLMRLPKYLEYLRRLSVEEEFISASQLARDLNLQSTQVRKDLATTGVIGVPKVGHGVKELIAGIESCLNWDSSVNAILIGVGNLGMAILGYEGFQNNGIKIVSSFDVKSELIRKNSENISVNCMDRLKEIIIDNSISIAIITTPASVAQKVAEEVVACGINAIWNFAPTKLQLSKDIIVENIDMYSSLALLSYKLKEYENINKLQVKE